MNQQQPNPNDIRVSAGATEDGTPIVVLQHGGVAHTFPTALALEVAALLVKAAATQAAFAAAPKGPPKPRLLLPA